MAIRARASITISRIVDISAVTRYYKLQSSTTVVPSKPTTNPPSDSWTTTEPSYTSGSTNTLYFVDCTVFTNDEFSYSDVSKSSSYEAAKEAYNKAENAQTRITNAETTIEENSNQIALRATADEVNEANSVISSLEAQLKIQADSISSLVRDSNGGSLITQDTEGLWFFNIGDLQSSVDNQNNKLDDIENKVSNQNDKLNNIEGDASVLKKDVDYLKGKTEYIRQYVDEDRKPCLELGKGDSAFKLKITNEQIQFIDGSEVPAYISNQKLMIEKAEVHNELRFGNFVWKERSNGNMGLVWEEATS
jgi:hypothetical protein